MRLGLLGPASGEVRKLEQGIRALFTLSVDRILYLGMDDVVDRLIEQWAGRLVGGDPSEEALWDRAAGTCARADATKIDGFLSAERKRQQLRGIQTLPSMSSRCVEMFGHRMAIALYDGELLDEEDIAAASFFFIGKNAEPSVERVGSKTFVSPGLLRGENSGIAAVTEAQTTDAAGGEVHILLLTARGEVRHSESVGPAPSGELPVARRLEGA